VDPQILTLVAESAGELVAFAQLHLDAATPACVSPFRAIELHRIYVERSFHGTGLAADLLSEVISTAERNGAAALWLGVWEHNPRAIRFYQRSGFVEAGDHVFVVGTDPQRDLLMVRELAH
jgi:diamine N-acetyltransferase